MSEIEFRHAVRDAIDVEMERDPSVVVFGEDVAAAGGVFQATRGLHEKYGSRRVFDTPISELALAGAAYGAAISGLRPVIEIMFGDFTMLAMDSLVNQAAKYWYVSNGQGSAPLVIRSAVGGGGGFAAIHSQIPATWLMGVPGIKIAAPSTPDDAMGLLRSAIQDDNPVVFLEHKRLYSIKGEVSGEAIPLSSAKVVRPGGDITIVTAMKAVHDAIEAAATLAEEGIAAEVVDLRTIRPLDLDTILASVAKTRRLVVVEEGPRTGGFAAEVLALLVEHAPGEFEQAWRVTEPDLPVPYSPPLEKAFLPGTEAIADSIRARLGVAAA